MDYIENFILESMTGDLRRGGTEVVGVVEGDTDLLTYGDHVRLVGKSLAGFDDLDFRPYFDGHVLRLEPLRFDALRSQTRIRIGTANFLMTGKLQDIGATEQGSPANPHQFAPTMRISDVFEHIVEDHCNFIFDATATPDGIINDTSFNSSDTAVARLNVHGSNNFWSALVQQLSGGEEGGVQFHRPYFDRRNKFYYQPTANHISPAPSSLGTLTKEHMRGMVRTTIRNQRVEDEVGQVEIIAVASSNVVYESVYPTTPGDGRVVRKTSGIWADSQARADTLAQNLYEWLTRPYTLTIPIDPGLLVYGDDGLGLDLANKIHVTYDGPTEDAATGAGVDLDLDLDCWVYGFALRPDPTGKTAAATVTLEADN